MRPSEGGDGVSTPAQKLVFSCWRRERTLLVFVGQILTRITAQLHRTLWKRRLRRRIEMKDLLQRTLQQLLKTRTKSVLKIFSFSLYIPSNTHTHTHTHTHTQILSYYIIHTQTFFLSKKFSLSFTHTFSPTLLGTHRSHYLLLSPHI